MLMEGFIPLHHFKDGYTGAVLGFVALTGVFRRAAVRREECATPLDCLRFSQRFNLGVR